MQNSVALMQLLFYKARSWGGIPIVIITQQQQNTKLPHYSQTLPLPLRQKVNNK